MKEKKIIKIAKEDLTIEELRTFEGFENISDEEGTIVLKTIITFSDIVVSMYLKQKSVEPGDETQLVAA